MMRLNQQNLKKTLQKWVVNKLIESFDIHPEDIKSCSMGVGGEDVVGTGTFRRKVSLQC